MENQECFDAKINVKLWTTMWRSNLSFLLFSNYHLPAQVISRPILAHSSRICNPMQNQSFALSKDSGFTLHWCGSAKLFNNSPRKQDHHCNLCQKTDFTCALGFVTNHCWIQDHKGLYLWFCFSVVRHYLACKWAQDPKGNKYTTQSINMIDKSFSPTSRFHIFLGIHRCRDLSIHISMGNGSVSDISCSPADFRLKRTHPRIQDNTPANYLRIAVFVASCRFFVEQY